MRNLPNTAPGIDGIGRKIVRNVWKVAASEMTLVYQKCVEEGVFPDVWKEGRLVVLPKGGDRPLDDPKSYRPITLLPVLGKILERVMIRGAATIVDNISQKQHGFRKGRSTVTAINTVLDAARAAEAKYVQLVLLDISGAFDNAWWPMILSKLKCLNCPPNVYYMLVDYFRDRKVGLFVGDQALWKRSTMGCPQGSVLGPALWNVLMDDVLRLDLPDGCDLMAYADDLTLIVKGGSRAEIESRSCESLRLIADWGVRNRLTFSPHKTVSMTVKGRLNRPPTIRMGETSIRAVREARLLGVIIDGSMSFGRHAQVAGEAAACCFGKMARVSTSSWGYRYRALKVVYKATYVACVTYAAPCWHHRSALTVVRTKLNSTQRPALILLTKAYRSVSTPALPVLAGVLPADFEVSLAGRRAGITASSPSELRLRRAQVESEILALWQDRWTNETRGRDLYRFFPDVSVRFKSDHIVPDHSVSQILTGHGCFRKRLHDMKLCERADCDCGHAAEDRDHVLWDCPLYDEERKELLSDLTRTSIGPVYYRELVDSRENFEKLSKFAKSWLSKRIIFEGYTGR